MHDLTPGLVISSSPEVPAQYVDLRMVRPIERYRGDRDEAIAHSGDIGPWLFARLHDDHAALPVVRPAPGIVAPLDPIAIHPLAHAANPVAAKLGIVDRG